ncbi:DUF305 domain-containing protein [Daejeonella sp.]|uniref:DUF305 domain-containing protein n=1 Tax=Daejeonella sp. TaxID=2805397 RepID=UPI0027157E0B|nr:DUF305 domain-containing protein [Daejeonella sp.]MDO8992279.1 DUF305 domain-containing protein [Daejeonella sp.]MDP2412737.1 DUF305 domain-containing protein [Daejeonella sp.]
MKTNSLIIGVFTLTLSFSACQNNASKTEKDHSSMDSNDMGMGSMSMSSGMKSGMDKMMMDMPEMDQSAATDKHFVQTMIPHHGGAIMMAEGFVQFGKDPVLIAMARKIITDQKMEIEEFKKWSE